MNCSPEAESDPVSAPPGHYTVQPERQGRLLWITGPPGLGKSTTAQLLSREKGKVFGVLVAHRSNSTD